MAVTQLLYPILTAVGVLLLINTLIFPEFSSGFLGDTTIETLGETVGALRDAGKYFISIAEGPKTDGEQEDEKPGEDLTAAPTAAERPKEKPKEDHKSLIKGILSIFKKSTPDDDKSKSSESPKPEPERKERPRATGLPLFDLAVRQ